MKNKINDSYKSIQITNDLENKIMEKTINKRKFSYKRLGYSLGLILLVFTISFSIVYAKQIAEFFKNWSTGVEFENGTKVNIVENANFKEINTNARKSENLISMTHDEVEQNLGFHILDYEHTTNKSMGYSTSLNSDGEIGLIHLWWDGFIDNTNGQFGKNGDKTGKVISVDISILNKGAEERYIYPFLEGKDATEEKELNLVYEIKKLNTKAVIYGNSWDETRLTASFVYDDVYYQFISYNYTKEELIEILEQLK